MNLFVCGWSMPEATKPVILCELQKMTQIYPQLDPETIWYFDVAGTVFASSIHTAKQAAIPRKYVWNGERQLVFYDGCSIDCTDRFYAHDAEQLCVYWDVLPESLEGQYAIVRINKNPPELSVLTDPLGIEQIYYLRHKDGWILSNSVQLLQNISHANAIDSLGVCLLLTVGWVGGDRTLRKDIRVMPGGQNWKWNPGSNEPDRTIFFQPSVLHHDQRRKLTQHEVENLAVNMTKMCRILSKSFGELQCPVTGGRDSRLLVALLASNGIKANYYTSGRSGCADIRIAKEITTTFNLPHEISDRDDRRVTTDWETICQRLIRQNDGMVSLWQVADVLNQPQHVKELKVNLHGLGGEIARSFYWDPRIFFSMYGKRPIKNLIARILTTDHNHLIRREALLITKNHLYDFVGKVLGEGFAPVDVSDIFYTFDRVRRWAGINNRKNLAINDNFGLFCTRPFIQAAFELPTLHRFQEPIHHELIRVLNPELHRIAFETEGWRYQHGLALCMLQYMAGFMTRNLHSRIYSGIIEPQDKQSELVKYTGQSAWLEIKRTWIRELCLDQLNSFLWDYVDRSIFEHITSHTENAAVRRSNIHGIYDIATLFLYFA